MSFGGPKGAFGRGSIVGLLGLMIFVTFGCEPARPGQATLLPAVATASTAPSTSSGLQATPAIVSPAAPPPNRLVFHVGSGGLDVAPPNLESASPREFATGIQASEPTIALLDGGAMVYQGWDRPASGAVGTSRVYVAEKPDGGWLEISPTPPGVTHDPYLTTDPRTGRILSAALLVPGELEPDKFCIVVSFTDDRGANWDQSDPICSDDADRPRLIASAPVISETGDASLITLCYVNGRADGQTCLRSLDGGATFRAAGLIPPDGCDPGPAGPLFGHLAADARGTLYLGRISCRRPVIAISIDEGTTWTEHVIGPEGWNGYPEVAVAVDDEGVIYGLWVAADRLPYLVASQDGGTTWAEPLRVSAPGIAEVNLVSMEAGAGGRLAIGAIVSTDAPTGPKAAVAVQCNQGPCTDAVFYEHVTWHASLTVTVDASAPSPHFATAILNDPVAPIVRGSCGPGRCKSNADFTDLVIDAQGQPWMAFVACPDGVCPTRPTGGYWGSSNGMLGTIDGVPLR